MSDTPTSPRRPGGAEAMREAAAKVAELWRCRDCGRTFHPDDNCVCNDPDWAGPLSQEEIAAAIRSLPLPAGDTLSTGGWNSDMEKAPKDGTFVLIAVKLPHIAEAVSGSAYYRTDDNAPDSAWWWAGEGPGDYYAEPIPAQPYAWMPMPEPPPGE